MSKEVILALYCPTCSMALTLDEKTMIRDQKWVIAYDIELAQFQAAAKLNMPPDAVSPAFLFDTGYATWLEMYPGEKKDILEERQGIMALAKTDPQKYLETIQSWNIERVEQLKADGWRKAQAA